MEKISFIIIMLAQVANASSSVDIYESKDPKNIVIEITVDSCMTAFKIPKNEFASFSRNEKAMNEMVKLAGEHAKSGCH